MAYSPPTVTADPSTNAETTTAMNAANAFVTTAYSDSVVAFQPVREYIKRTEGHFLDAIDTILDTLRSPGNTNVSIVGDPVTQAQGNTAFATLVGYVDSFDSRISSGMDIVYQVMHRGGGKILPRQVFNDALGTFRVAKTAITIASDPASKADMNAALATLTGYVDSINSSMQTMLQQVREQARLAVGSKNLLTDIDTALALYASH